MLLEVKGISKNFGGVAAVDNFSMTAEKGKIHGIIGPNGAGKTTIFNLISGVYTIDKGQVFLEGTDITKMEQHKITHHGIGRTFQNIRLFHGLTVLENTMCAFDPNSNYGFISSILPFGKRIKEEKRGRKICEEFLDIVGLIKYKDERPENLAYGLQRKLEIARAITSNPKVLLLDEPAAGLNPTEVVELTELIDRLRKEFDLSILLIEHRLELVMQISDEIYVQNFGKTIAIGTPEEVQNNPEVIEAYLGEEELVC